MKSRFDAALRALSSLVPAALGGMGATVSAQGTGLGAALAAHDPETVRSVGVGFSGAFRALDLLVSAPMMVLPVGTRSLRAAIASAIVTGVCGALAFDVVRALVASVPAALRRVGLRRDSGEISPRLVSAVSAVAVLTALLSPAWQAEAAAPGGAVIGAALVLVALRLVSAVPAKALNLPASALVVGLAASYDPLLLVATLGALAPPISTSVRASRPSKAVQLQSLVAFALGLLPLALGALLVRRPPEVSVFGSMFAFARGAPVSLAAFAGSEMGPVMSVVCVGGAFLSLFAVETRRNALPHLAVFLVGAVAVALHAPAGPNRFGPAVLVGISSAYALGAVMLGAIVVVIASMRVPLAEASAALVVVLELVLPVRAFDDTTTRREAHAAHASSIWNDVAWGSMPPGAVVLVSEPETMRRIASARATGQMRGDLLIVPAFDVLGAAAQRALIAEPKLAPLYRDMALGTSPEELSLATLGAQRAVFATFQPKWDRALARHLVPAGLFSRFEAEPRSATERKKALEAFAPVKERLVRTIVTKKDAELAAATAVLLRARAIGMAAAGDRELLERALDDLRAFAPDDPVGTILVRRSITTKGAIDVSDLAR